MKPNANTGIRSSVLVYHTIITGISDGMRATLPNGLTIVGNQVKVPRNNDAMKKAFFSWCQKFNIGTGFSL